MCYYMCMQMNFFSYWLSTSIKPIWYKIWRYIAFFVIFLLWVLCIGVYQDMYWKLSYAIITPAIVLDVLMNLLLYYLSYKKNK